MGRFKLLSIGEWETTLGFGLGTGGASKRSLRLRCECGHEFGVELHQSCFSMGMKPEKCPSCGEKIKDIAD